MPIVKAPLVIAKGEAGNDLYLYEGSQVPSLAEGELERLADYFEDEGKPERKPRGKSDESEK